MQPVCQRWALEELEIGSVSPCWVVISGVNLFLSPSWTPFSKALYSTQGRLKDSSRDLP